MDDSVQARWHEAEWKNLEPDNEQADLLDSHVSPASIIGPLKAGQFFPLFEFMWTTSFQVLAIKIKMNASKIKCKVFGPYQT